jgi:predicted nuclease of predicted toxin-antitoxin system
VTPARLLLDEMLSPKIGAALEAHGHDVATVTQRPDLMALHDDEPILAAAAAENRVVVTANIGDFAALDAQWNAEGRAHAGIVLVTTSQFPQDRSFIGRVANALLDSAATGTLPGPNQTLYLRPAEPPQA